MLIFVKFFREKIEFFHFIRYKHIVGTRLNQNRYEQTKNIFLDFFRHFCYIIYIAA